MPRCYKSGKPTGGEPPGRQRVYAQVQPFDGTGHGVAVLLKIYAHCIDGQADAVNQRITDALGTKDTEPEPGGEEDGDSKKAS